MSDPIRTGRRRWVLPLVSALVAMVASAGLAAAATPTDGVIVLPDASSAEGIAKGAGATFYAGDLLGGDIFRGDLQRGTAELFIDAPAGRMAVGMFADVRHRLLFVAGGPGAAYVYDTGSGAPVADYQLGGTSASFINDVVVAGDGAWFTDSLSGRLFLVPISRAGVPVPSAIEIPLTGPAAAIAGEFNLNGITATPNGDTLIVAHTANGALCTVDPSTGASESITGVSVPGVDGIVLEAGRLWAVQGSANSVARVRLSPDLGSGVIEETITDTDFQFPTTTIRFGNHLAVVNGKFDTGFPPTADHYEVVLVSR
ncbi:MAG TPA: hypothetical protein VIT42_08255 [Microlunatus sp.]